jgi:hypothetical protein
MTMIKPTTECTTAAPIDAPQHLADRGDLWLLVGAALTGTGLLSVVGGPMMVFGIMLLRRAARAGAEIRPWTVTIVGVFLLIDTTLNGFGWAMDLLPAHDTSFVQTFFSGVGRIMDGGYYIHYNNLPLGGTAAVGEKGMQIACTIFLFPLRLAAVWGFLKMKRWGFHYVLLTTWLYVFVWMAYAGNLAVTFENRIGASELGMLGYWFFNIPFFGAFFTLPYLYTVNSRAWSK